MLNIRCSLLCFHTTDVNDDQYEEGEIKGGAVDKEERSGTRARLKDANKGESKSTTTEKSVERGANKVDVFPQIFESM